MELITLNNQYQQSKYIQNYDTLLWTERFNGIGDFTIETGDSRFLNILPKGTVLSLRESTVPMVVERHLIERKKGKPALFKITGRDFTKILGQRISIQSVVGALSEWYVDVKQPSDVAHYIIYKICVEGILDPKDIFEPAKVQFIPPSDYLESFRPTRRFTVARGNLLTTVLGLLQVEADADFTTTPVSPPVEPHGLRAMRPSTAGTAIGIQIYKGVDRTSTVRFDASRDLLEDSSYLFADESYADSAYVLGPNTALKLRKGDSDVSGLARRTLLVDGSGSAVSDADALKNEGTAALMKAKRIARFEGSINPDISPYIFNRDYGLGDIVQTVGDYGLSTPARVTEYIRSDSSAGSKAYPTLVSIDKDEEIL